MPLTGTLRTWMHRLVLRMRFGRHRGAARPSPSPTHAAVPPQRIDISLRPVLDAMPSAGSGLGADRRTAMTPVVEGGAGSDTGFNLDTKRPPFQDDHGAGVTAAPSAGGLSPASRFLSGICTHAQGRRAFKLFLPSRRQPAVPPSLLVMLHGCNQDPDDFATGTRMNAYAEAVGWVVLYPTHPRLVDPSGCWDWFSADADGQETDEAATIAGMTRMVAAQYDVDPRRVYAAGLASGGAMAATLGALHPDIYAAVGIHSGLPHAAACDVMAAFDAMRHGPNAGVTRSRQRHPARPVPTIVFHGDRDEVVHHCNGVELIAQVALQTHEGANAVGGTCGQTSMSVEVETGRMEGGHAYTRTIQRTAAGKSHTEHWLVHGAGHAWFGGSPRGSCTDTRGPDASRAMLRFFSQQRRPLD